MHLAKALTILLLAKCAIIAGKDENKTFEATNEWQEIKEGQEIPAGLHVRINLQTKKKEAKLYEPEKDDHKHSALSNVVENEAKTNHKEAAKPASKISKTLSEALKSLPKERLSIDYSPEQLEQIKRDFKTYSELKKSFSELKDKFKTDAELITQLLNEYKNLSKEHELSLKPQTKLATKLRILEDLDYLVHQIDNALWFIDEGGLEQILLPLVVNETNIDLRIKAVRVLGAVTLNNPKAQIKAFELNFGSHLTQILVSSTVTEELSATLYALGSLLRKFPLALQKILSTSGTQALITVLAKECELKVKAKAITLISDIIVEKNLVLSNYSDSDNPLAAAQYADLNISEWLQSNAFCETVDRLISTNLYELLDQPDSAEYFVIGLESSEKICKSVWSTSPQLRHTLLTIKNRYMHSQNEFRIEVAQMIERLIEVLYSSKSHEEL
ncbi:nucleotide exchange factor Sil1 [Anastrepha ludens]|uniref:nucleotide exchange factor Sil1 n=1 Tax=Anastrepha ludens TaxID=28586 RepID=UPI0023B01FE8|nr:nucleotide exchange factor Sil1 [Anastrepha ludens]